MDGLFTLLLFAGLFYVMMRWGCGAHMVHGHGGGGQKAAYPSDHGDHVPTRAPTRAGPASIDPVCGMVVARTRATP
jgi:hypothetical protein